MYIDFVYQGTPPTENAERLLLCPVESKLKILKLLKEMKLNVHHSLDNDITVSAPRPHISAH